MAWVSSPATKEVVFAFDEDGCFTVTSAKGYSAKKTVDQGFTNFANAKQKASFENQFDTLAKFDDDVNNKDVVSVDVVHFSPRKMRAASIGVKKLVQDVMPQKRKSKGKNVKVDSSALDITSSISKWMSFQIIFWNVRGLN